MSLFPSSRRIQSLLTGCVGGFFSGLTGVGGGTILVPLFTAVLKLPQHTAHGTSLTVVLFAAGASTVAYIWRGDVDWELFGALAVGAMIGAYAGARVMMLIPARWLQIIFGCFLLTAGIRMLVTG